MCRSCKKVIFVWKITMPCNERFTKRATWSVLEIRALTFTHGSRKLGPYEKIGLRISQYGPSNPISNS